MTKFVVNIVTFVCSIITIYNTSTIYFHCIYIFIFIFIHSRMTNSGMASFILYRSWRFLNFYCRNVMFDTSFKNLPEDFRTTTSNINIPVRIINFISWSSIWAKTGPDTHIGPNKHYDFKFRCEKSCPFNPQSQNWGVTRL